MRGHKNLVWIRTESDLVYRIQMFQADSINTVKPESLIVEREKEVVLAQRLSPLRKNRTQALDGCGHSGSGKGHPRAGNCCCERQLAELRSYRRSQIAEGLAPVSPVEAADLTLPIVGNPQSVYGIPALALGLTLKRSNT